MEKMLHVLIISCLLFKVSAAKISGYGNTTAVYGEDAHYRCAMDNSAGVLQVTWQRLFRDQSIENLATYNNRFGQQINEPYKGKVIFTEASLSSTSITLKNATWEDESCYICSFNVYPDGSTRKQTCLTVQGISEVNITQVTIKDHEEEDREVVFSCSATGKPAPTIQWDISAGATHLDQPQTTTVTNSDQTFTSSCSITLRMPPDWNGHVDCLMNRGMKGERQERIHVVGRPKKAEESVVKEGTRLWPSGIAVAVVVVIFISSIVVAVVMRRKRLKGNRRNSDDTHEEEFAFQQQNCV